jgi:hypothetical protein
MEMDITLHVNNSGRNQITKVGSVRTFLQLPLPGMNTGHGYNRVCDVTEERLTPNVRHYKDYKSIEVARLSRIIAEHDWTPIFNLFDYNEQVCYFNDLIPWRRFCNQNMSNPIKVQLYD